MQTMPLLSALESFRTPLSRWSCGLGVAVVLIAGCNSERQPVTSANSEFEVADDTATEAKDPAGGDLAPSTTGTPLTPDDTPRGGDSRPPATVQQPPSVPADALGTIEVPDGPPEELLRVIEKVDRSFPRIDPRTIGTPQDRDRLMAQIEQLNQVKLEAAEKLLAAEIDRDTRMTAINAKLGALSALVRPDKPDSVLPIRRFALELSNNEDAEIARNGKVIVFSMQIGEVASQQSDDIDGLVRAMEALLKDEGRDQAVMGVVQQAAMAVQRIDEKRGRAMLKSIAEAFKDNADTDLAEQAAEIQDHLNMVELDIDKKLLEVVRGEAESSQPFLDAMQQLLSDQPGFGVYDSVNRAVGMLERSQKYEESRAILAMVEKAYQDHPDEQLRQAATETAQRGRKRLELIGQPLEVEGPLADGSSLDWASYRGKFVLLDFWAAESSVSAASTREVKRLHTKFASRGFDVIGVNFDRTRQLADALLEQEGIPWANIFFPQGENKMVEKCGADSLPFRLLIDPEGKVIEMHPPLTALEQRLEELLPADKATPDNSPKPGNPGGGQGGGSNPSGDEAGGNAEAGSGGQESASSGRQRSAPEPTSWFVSWQDETGTSPGDEQANPYLAPADASKLELLEFLLDMPEKPQSIQRRPGFREALVEAADRLLAADPSARQQLIAIETKLQALHTMAAFGNESADEQLQQFVNTLHNDSRPAVQEQVKFFQLECQAINADELPLERIPDLLDRLATYLGAQDLTSRHVRMASSTVRAINRIENDDEREQHFARFGKLFAASKDKQLAAYGKKLAKPAAGPAGSALVGTRLELAGLTALGAPFNWEAYRGKVVLVDFWATWCGPCVREMPNVRALYDKLHQQGFDIVAVSLDRDLDQLAAFLEQHKIPWTNIIGDDAKRLAEQYQVRGIPMMMLVDHEGKVIAVSHRVAELADEATRRVQK